MNCLLAALKNGKVRNHGIPVMLGEYRRLLPAMRQKSAAPKDKGQPLPGSPLAPGPGYTGLIRHLGKIPQRQPFPEFDVPLVAEVAAGRNYGELEDLEVRE